MAALPRARIGQPGQRAEVGSPPGDALDRFNGVRQFKARVRADREQRTLGSVIAKTLLVIFVFTAYAGAPTGGARSRNLLFHRQALCQLSYRHHGRRRGGMGWESKPSSVPDGHLSRPQRDRPRRHLRGGSRLPASASNLLAADSEIAAGRIALFTPVNRYWSLLLSRGRPRANLDCRRAVSRAPPRLSPGTLALCSSDFPLAPKRQRPSLPTPCLGCQCAGRFGCQGLRVSGDRSS